MKNRGFTLIELMVVVVIIGILAAIAIPNFIAMQERARQSSVKGNMHTVQLSAEAYAVDFNGAYPTGDDVANEGYGYYFPGGDEQLQTVLGQYPNNPYTGIPMTPADFQEFVYAASGDNSDQSAGGPNDANLGGAGLVRYGVFSTSGAWPWHEWGCIGSRKDFFSIRSGGGTNVVILVLHN